MERRRDAGPSGARWRALVREIEACRRCPLGSTRQHVVIYRGAARPRVVFVGEAPGRQEDAEGVPFVGRAGRRLDEALRTLGLPASAYGILNVVKCHPPGNRLSPEPLRACRPFLDRQLALLRPRLLVPMGARALAALDARAPTVTRASGMLRTVGSLRLFPLLHPAATFRSGRAMRQWNRDLGRLRRWLDAHLESL